MSQILTKNHIYPKWVVFQFTNTDNPNSYDQVDFSKVNEVIEATFKKKPHYELFIDDNTDIKIINSTVEKINANNCDVEVVCSGIFDVKKLQQLLGSNPYQLWFEIFPSSSKYGNIQSYIRKQRESLQLCRELIKKNKISDTKIGLSLWINYLTYRYISEIISSIKNTIDIFSIEFQRYLTNSRWLEYKELLYDKFNLNTELNRDLVDDTNDNKTINFDLLEEEIFKARAICLNHNIKFYARPKTIDKDNYFNYFNGLWDKMPDNKKTCIYPFILLEINKYGQVSLCHNFYDSAIGNIWEQYVLDIFFNEKAIQIRNYSKKQLMPNCIACSRYYD